MAALGAVSMAASLLGPSAEKLLKDLTFNNKVSDKSSNDYLHFDIAPSFGALQDGTAIKQLDDNLLVMMTATHKLIANMPAAERSWDNIVAALKQNSLISPHPDDPIDKTDYFIKEGKQAFKFDGSPSSTIVNEVNAWFTKLISDEDVQKTLGFNIDVLANIVAQTGATVSSFVTAIGKVEEHSKDILDIGILRYPDLNNPFFKIYRLQLKAWSKCDRTLAFEKNENGIRCDYKCQKYIPNKTVMDKLNPEITKKAVSEAEAFLGGL